MAPPERRRRSTQRDNAQHAGVSRATVSLVISGGAASTRIAESTRRAVLAAAEEPGYAANVAARGLKGGPNRLLGLYTFEPVFPTDQRDFYVGGANRPKTADGCVLLGRNVRRPTT